MGPLDLAIVAAYLISVVGVGAWFSRRQKTTRHYFTAGGRVPWWAVSASIVATETSTITFISVPGIAFARGGNFTFLQLAFGYLLGRVAISLLFIPAYFKGELLTVYQLLTTRFGEGVKGLLAALFVVMRTIADGVRLLLTATVLAAVIAVFVPALDADLAVIGAVVALGLVMILFTLWGGMEAVIWIEVAQLAIYLLGALAAAAILLAKIPGGFDAASAAASQFGKWRLFNLDPTFSRGAGITLWAGLVGGCFLNMSTHGTDQYLVQRYLCTDGPRRASAALLTSGVVVLAQFALFLTIGVLLFAFYRPFDAGSPVFERTDQVFPAFITHELPPGVAGLVVAAILAAALSSSLNSIAATTVNDLLRPFARARDDAHFLRVSKGLTVVAGVAQVAVALAFRSSKTSALDTALEVAALLNGPVLGVFLLGAFTRRAGRLAALGGMAAGLGAVLYVRFAPLDVHWAWYTALGSLTTLAVGAALGRARA